jgi:hypothetical protein
MWSHKEKQQHIHIDVITQKRGTLMWSQNHNTSTQHTDVTTTTVAKNAQRRSRNTLTWKHIDVTAKNTKTSKLNTLM